MTKGSFEVVPAGERPDQRSMWDGFSNALVQAFEFAGVTVIFVLAGLWLDNRFGTRPTFIVAFGMLAVMGLGVRAYYTYAAQISRDEEGKPWTRSQR